jgi:hypothetical protein
MKLIDFFGLIYVNLKVIINFRGQYTFREFFIEYLWNMIRMFSKAQLVKVSRSVS